MAQQRTITLEIAGARYRMVTDAPEEHLRRLAGRINERAEAIVQRAGKRPAPAQLLALVALELADALEHCEAKLDRVQRLTQQGLQSILQRIDRRLQGELAPASASQGGGDEGAAAAPSEPSEVADAPSPSDPAAPGGLDPS